MPAPLEGIKVVDLSLGLQGPYCAMMLADMGAEVIKIERPDIGEGMRYMYLSHIQHGMSVSFAAVNRGKRSMALDIRPEAGREIFLKLVHDADVLVQNFRPGVMARLGYGWEDLSKINPNLVMVSLSGYGEEGPHAGKAGQDLLAQAHSGIISLMGYDDDQNEPYSVGSPIGDTSGAISGAWGAVVALLARERFGGGQEVTGNLADALVALAPVDWADYLHSGEIRKGGRGWYPNMPYGPWRTRDRDVVVNPQGDFGWHEFCLIVGLPEIENDPRFATNADRVQHRRELEAILGPVFRSRDAKEWQELFEGMGMRCDPVNNYRDLEQDPQTTINQMIITQEHPQYGSIRTVGQAVKLNRTPGAASSPDHLPPPLFAEHTREVLVELGYDDDAIAALEADGVVNTAGMDPSANLADTMAALRGRPRTDDASRRA